MSKENQYQPLEKTIDYVFTDKNILKQSLTHNSYINENELDFNQSNERLEFLGDALLDGVVAEIFYNMYPSYTEGELSLAKSNLVSRNCLGQIALDIDLGKYLRVGKGIKTQKNNNISILSCAMEALFAAIYLDGGTEALHKAVKLLLGDKFHDVKLVAQENYKGKLQQITQEDSGSIPDYRILEEKGPDHSKEFSVGVYLGDKLLAKGYGTSKKKAQLDAAKNAINLFQI